MNGTLRSEFRNATIEEATAAADAIYEIKGKTIFVRAIEDGDEWGFEALETTMSGKLATVGGFPDYAYDTREEAVAKIESLVKRYSPVRRVK